MVGKGRPKLDITDAERAERIKQQNRDSMRKRFANDPEYAERKREYTRNYFRRIREAKLIAMNESTNISI